jgi:hypothetical protein
VDGSNCLLLHCQLVPAPGCRPHEPSRWHAQELRPTGIQAEAFSTPLTLLVTDGGEDEAPVTAHWTDLGLDGKQVVRNLWRQPDIGLAEKEFQASVPRHGVVRVRLIPAK